MAFSIFIWRLNRKENAGKSMDSPDILLGLFSQKAREAKVAAERLSRIADELGVGLIERTRNRDLIANSWARKFVPVESEDIARLDELIRRNDFPVTLRRGDLIIEVRRREAGVGRSFCFRMSQKDSGLQRNLNIRKGLPCADR